MVVGLLKVVEHVLQGGFVYKPFALVDIPDKDTEGEVCADACNKKTGTDNQCCRNGPSVHFVLQDHHVVDTVRKPSQQR